MKNLIKIFVILFTVTSINAQTLLYFDIGDLNKIKTEYKKIGTNSESISAFISIYEEEKNNIPFTLTKYESPVGSKGLHDYFSDSPYWWPIPGDSTAPYIRHDGVRNPDRFMKHKKELQNFYKTVVSLVYASYFTDNKEYAKEAGKLLSIWFVDETTKMNPNLKYSQMIKNRTEKRGVGIIEGRKIALLTDAINLLKLNHDIDNNLYSSIRAWYKEFFIWLTESDYGLDEKKRGNNHSTWWAMQVATIANFLNYKKEIKEIGDYSKHFLLDNQFNAKARQPMEEARTKSLAYCIFNVTAHSYLNSALFANNIDNWNYINKNGVKLIDAINYLIPYLKNPSEWRLKQITKINNHNPVFLAITGLKLNKSNYIKTYDEFSMYGENDLYEESFDPMQIVFNMIIKNRLKNYEQN